MALRAADVAEASLASLYALRRRFLPAARMMLPEDVTALSELIGQQRPGLASLFPPEQLPPAVLRGNLAAFLLHALDLARLPPDERSARIRAWFSDPRSSLHGHPRRDATRGRMIRTPCCLRELAGASRCRTCPRRAS